MLILHCSFVCSLKMCAPKWLFTVFGLTPPKGEHGSLPFNKCSDFNYFLIVYCSTEIYKKIKFVGPKKDTECQSSIFKIVGAT